MNSKLKELQEFNIVEKYNDNYSNDVFKLLINKEYYILKFYNSKRKMENEIRITNIIVNDDCKILYKGLKDSKYYIIRKYIEGELLSNNKLDLDISKKIGEVLKHIHSIKFDSNLKIYSTEEIFLKWVKNIGKSNLNIDKINEVFQKQLEKYDTMISISHMDFRLGNIIINKDLELKVIDFEHSKLADKYFDFVKIRRELKKYDGFWESFKKGYDEDLNESKIDFYEFIHSIGAISFIYLNNRNKDTFYYENVEYLNKYIKKYIG